MARVTIKCPEKYIPVPTGIESDRGEAWDQLNVNGKSLASCPACGKTHPLMKREAVWEVLALGRLGGSGLSGRSWWAWVGLVAVAAGGLAIYAGLRVRASSRKT